MVFMTFSFFCPILCAFIYMFIRSLVCVYIRFAHSILALPESPFTSMPIQCYVHYKCYSSNFNFRFSFNFIALFLVFICILLCFFSCYCAKWLREHQHILFIKSRVYSDSLSSLLFAGSFVLFVYYMCICKYAQCTEIYKHGKKW